MNHDYAHCADYEWNKLHCPESCFRRQLTEDLKEHPVRYTSWIHFAGTEECPLKSFVIKQENEKIE